MASKSKGRVDHFNGFVKYLAEHLDGARVIDIAAYLGVEGVVSIYMDLDIEQHDLIYCLALL